MGLVPLLGAAYDGKSVIASGQTAINVYAETNTDPQAPVPITYYDTPGSAIYSNPNVARKVRGSYRTSIGTAYVVIGSNLYFLDVNRVLILIGFVADLPSQVYFADNGLVTVLVDGLNGYVIDMASNQFGQITDPSFYDCSFALFLDTFFIFNRLGTNQFFISAGMASYGMLTNTGIEDGTIVGGAGYVNGTYDGVELTGGSGVNAEATIIVGGTGVRTGTITAGTLYTDGVYTDVPLNGGAGAGAKATITIAAGLVTIVTPTTAGTGYVVGNDLTILPADVGGTGSGFSWNVDTLGGAVITVNVTNPGYNYLVLEALSVDAADIGGVGAGFSYTITETQTAFDPLDIAAKAGSADPIVAMLTVHKELWLIGELTCEIWIGTGAADFYFQQQQGAYIDHGCIAPYSAANIDVATFWLMQDKQGKGIVVKGVGYDVSEVSTPKMVQEFRSYETMEDAIGMCLQIDDHAFYALIFPRANKSWLLEIKSGNWSQWAWTDENGNFNRHRANCCMFVYGENIIGDWENGELLYLDPNLFKDKDNPIVRVRTLSHMIKNGSRVFYNQFIAYMEVGTSIQLSEDEEPPKILLSWSDDAGVTFGNPVEQSLGKQGQFKTQPSWNRLGMARDRIFKLQWSANARTALNGGFVDVEEAGS